jgi:hypothetical protein
MSSKKKSAGTLKKSVTAKEFDRIFDEGKEDVVQYLDLSSVRHPNKEAKRVNVDFPLWMVTGLDAVAARFGVTRQSVIKMWIAEKLQDAAANQPLLNDVLTDDAE